MHLSVEQIKKHLNIDFEYDEDNEYFEYLEDVAEKIVENHIDKKIELLCDEGGKLPSPLMHAMLYLIGNFYNNRESVSNINYNELPLSYSYILDLYKNYRTEKIDKVVEEELEEEVDDESRNIEE